MKRRSKFVKQTGPQIGLDQTRNGHGAKKFQCPGCGHKKRFVRYYNFTTGEYLADEYGRCDRMEHCGYFKHPFELMKAEGAVEPTNNRVTNWREYPKLAPSPIKPVDRDLFKATLNFYESNRLYTWLCDTVGKQQTDEAFARYFIGTARGGATIFWQIDKQMRVRTGQRILYGQDGKRDKTEFPKRLFLLEHGYMPCLFGEHLLYQSSGNPTVCIVESEKTALIASIYLPAINGKPVIWMAAGGVNGLTEDKMRALAGMDIVLVPDFSYHARATWGAITPMRKLRNDKGQRVPDPHGDIDEDFTPYSEKLRKIGCTVRCWDPYPDVTDSSDIADYLILQKPKISLKRPDLTKLVVQNFQNAPQSHRNTPNFDDKVAGNVFVWPEVQKYFKIRQINDGWITALIEPEPLRNKVEEILNHPNIRLLHEKFDICAGSIERYNLQGHGT